MHPTSEELPSILASERRRGLTVVPVVLKPCRFAGTPLADLQSINPIDRPLIRMDESEQEEIWMGVTQAIEDALAEAPPSAAAAPAAAEPEALLGPVRNVPYERNPFFSGRTACLTHPPLR